MATTNKLSTGASGERIERRGLAQQLAARTTGITEAQMYDILGEFGNVVTENLQRGVTVALTGFGTFKPTERAARMGRDIRTQQPIEIPAQWAAKFSAGANLKTALAGSTPSGSARSRTAGAPTAQTTTASTAPSASASNRRGRGGAKR